MNTFTFYIEGLSRSVAAQAVDEKAAWKNAWANLSDEEKNYASSHECIEVVDYV